MAKSRPNRVKQISGHAKLTPKFRHMATVLHGPRFVRDIDSMIEDAVAVDALAGLLDRAIDHGLAKDGRLDLRESAMFMIKEMRRNQK